MEWRREQAIGTGEPKITRRLRIPRQSESREAAVGVPCWWCAGAVVALGEGAVGCWRGRLAVDDNALRVQL